MPQFEVWMEGYVVSGNRDTACLVGKTEADSFKDACVKLMAAPPWNDGSYDPVHNTYWGCRLFDNEVAARKFVG